MKSWRQPHFVTVTARSAFLWISLLMVVLLGIGLFAGVGDWLADRREHRDGLTSPREGSSGHNGVGVPGDSSGGSSDGSGSPMAGLLLAGIKIAVDPGHGGVDQGVCHFPDSLIEKEINLDMARRLREALQQHGAEVFVTRDEDVYVGLTDRATAANTSGAQLFVSLHVNRIPGHPECFGAQTFYYPEAVEGRKLAEAIQAHLLKADPDNHRTALSGSYKVLRLTDMPGALVEIGFMTNARDRALLQGDEYRVRMTDAIVDGIVEYVGSAGHSDETPMTPPTGT